MSWQRMASRDSAEGLHCQHFSEYVNHTLPFKGVSTERVMKNEDDKILDQNETILAGQYRVDAGFKTS